MDSRPARRAPPPCSALRWIGFEFKTPNEINLIRCDMGVLYAHHESPPYRHFLHFITWMYYIMLPQILNRSFRRRFALMKQNLHLEAKFTPIVLYLLCGGEVRVAFHVEHGQASPSVNNRMERVSDVRLNKTLRFPAIEAIKLILPSRSAPSPGGDDGHVVVCQSAAAISTIRVSLVGP